MANSLLRAVLVFIVALASLVPTAAFAQTEPVAPRNPPSEYSKGYEPKLETFRYFMKDTPPIPVGELIKIVKADSNSVTLEWEKRLGFGKKTRLVRYDGISFSFTSNGITSVYNTGVPPNGALGVILEYTDNTNAAGEFKPDGIVDGMTVSEYRELTSEDEALLKISDEMLLDSKAQGLIFVQTVHECNLTVELDGKPAKEGPYGYSYYVPDGGATLSLRCFDHVLTYGKVVAGDRIHATRNYARPIVSSWELCRLFPLMRPQWQTSTTTTITSCGIHSRTETSTEATLARLGFHKQHGLTNGSASVNGFARYSHLLSEVELNKLHPDSPWPKLTWKNYPWLDPNGTIFMIDIPEVKGQVVDFKTLLRTSDMTTSASASARIDDPIVFFRNVDLTPGSKLDWRKAEFFRFVLEDGKLVLQKATIVS